MVKSFKLKKNNQLTIVDELVYSLISCYSDRNGVSKISRQCLASKTGIKKLDTITAHTNKLEELGLIKKTYTTQGGKKLVQYQVLDLQEDFIWVSNDITRYRPGLIGFMIKMAGLR